MFDLSMLMAHKQCCVTVMLNKCHYTNEIVVFDMFTVILANIFDFFKTMTPLVEAVFSQ